MSEERGQRGLEAEEMGEYRVGAGRVRELGQGELCEAGRMLG